MFPLSSMAKLDHVFCDAMLLPSAFISLAKSTSKLESKETKNPWKQAPLLPYDENL